MRRMGACVGVLALPALLGVVGCASAAAERPLQESAAHGLAFEISADLADTCRPTGRPRVLAADAVDSVDSVVVRAHDGWLSVAFTSKARGRVTLDLEPQTLNVLVARAQDPASLPMSTGALSAADANGHGLVAFLVPGPTGMVIAAAPLDCPHSIRSQDQVR